ncbi:hypothetical protein [Embleya scabrispora]|uniref:hypothetical protein n=1 Tax=Embleya scabrispora TaxID=159449 RepID=UPI0003775762|nr:hypothetical protein [Embleya scabrispora]MYS82722.1 hypothetical protein [Streptomyces sp. SID5474]
MVDDGTQVLEAPRFAEVASMPGDPAPTTGSNAEGIAPGVESAHLVARMRHGRGVLARVATTLNNHGVRRLSYVSTEFGAATVEVTVCARDAARVEARLRRMVETLEVTRVVGRD